MKGDIVAELQEFMALRGHSLRSVEMKLGGDGRPALSLSANMNVSLPPPVIADTVFEYVIEDGVGRYVNPET